MARPATGSIRERRGKNGTTFAIRFRAYGRPHHVTLGSTEGGWTRARVEAELANVLADVRRGVWKPAAAVEAVIPPEDPSFHEFASEWLEAVSPALADRTVERYRWQLTSHLLPFFHRHGLSEITVAEGSGGEGARTPTG